ncbi:MAG: hypothetical protein ACTSYS_02135 [Promethearchaeota archaeon]
MARIGRKKLFIDFEDFSELAEKLDMLKKKIKTNMVIRMPRKNKLEIDIRGSKEDIRIAILRIKQIISEE